MIDRERFYQRPPGLVVVGAPDGYLLIDGQVTEIATAAPPGVWSSLWQRLMHPTSGADLANLIEALPPDDAEALAGLVAGGQLLSAPDAGTVSRAHAQSLTDNRGYHLEGRAPACANLVLACTGSIVTGLMAPTVLSLCYAGFQQRLELLLTRSALRFATRELFEHYGIRTWVEASEQRDGIRVPHVSLGAAAECVLVMPASAASLYRLAHATCEDLLSLTVAATRAPVIVSPVMNAAMWNAPAVQRNLARLRADGVYVIEPGCIFGATELTAQGDLMYGGPGTLWRGPEGVMRTLEAVLAHAA